MDNWQSDGAILPDLNVKLYPHQKEALSLLGNGKVLWGGVGSGKSITAMTYYMINEAPRDVYVITTAKKRDSLDWEDEAAKFGVGKKYGATVAGVLTVDSWNNASKYTDVEDAFFIFDEQRVVGYGAWVKSFLKITKKNRWILLSATPGDTWLDYAPLFIANGWYKNITDFRTQHVIYAPRVSFPIVKGYVGEQKLERLKKEILVEMSYMRHTTRHVNGVICGYDKELVDYIIKRRWNPFEDRPITDKGELFRLMRMIGNSDPSRLDAVKWVMKIHPRLVIFYNFDYELEILRTLQTTGISVGEWNGHKKVPVPDTEKWVYLVQYAAGSEGWNCTSTNAMVLYSLTYSYKNYVQAMGRIDRLDTPYKDLYYYVIESWSPLDLAVKQSLEQKRNFNESGSELARQIFS